ncbi:hypothetical protein [Chitinophaga sp. OAE865]|uniref:hypothetical protein n=1 Tax=Chitinophaga sp. OAE865 TaxID=2817898 RepID=UPI001AE15F25
MYSEERIKEKAINESGIDTDWFLMDSNGKIAVVASAGGLLPDSVSSDMERLKRMIEYFRSLPILSDDIIIDERVLKLIDSYNGKQKDAYLKDLYFMASRGLYYFDKMILNDYSDFRYYLKAKPIKPLVIGKNINSKDVLPLTTIDRDMENINQFMVNEIL